MTKVPKEALNCDTHPSSLSVPGVSLFSGYVWLAALYLEISLPFPQLLGLSQGGERGGFDGSRVNEAVSNAL